METGIKSSFIPQVPVAGSAQVRRSGGGGFDFLMLIALVLFVASATLAAGVFLYVQFLERSNVSKQDQLQRAQAAFEPALIAELQRIDSRMRAADQILENHVAPLSLFQLLEQTTLQTIAFSRFDFAAANTGMKLAMEGLAESVNSIALQANLFSQSGVVMNPIFADINRQIGGVHFSVDADVRPEALDYRTNFVAPNAQIVPQQQAPQDISPFGSPDGSAPPASDAPSGSAPTGTTTPPADDSAFGGPPLDTATAVPQPQNSEL